MPSVAIAEDLTEPPNPGVEDIVEVTQFDLKGTVGSHQVGVHLLRTNNRFNGYYWYEKNKFPAKSKINKQHKPSWKRQIHLSGELDEQTGDIKLTERSAKYVEASPENTTGIWYLKLADRKFQGTWQQKERVLPVTLSDDGSTPILPFQMKVRLRTPKGFSNLDIRNYDLDCKDNDSDLFENYAIDEIYLYRNSQLVQTLAGFNTIGICTPSFPTVSDVKFNKQPAIVVSLSRGFAFEHYYRLWTYDAAKARFVANDAWDELFNGIEDPVFDPVTKTFSVCWTGRFDGEFGSRTYRWRNHKLFEVGGHHCGDAEGGESCGTVEETQSYRRICANGDVLSWPF